MINMSTPNENGRGKDFFIGAVIGGVLGAVTALLLAPKSGKELRADLSEQVQTVSQKTQELASNVSVKTQEIASNVSSKTQEIAGNVSNKTQELAKQVTVQTGELLQKAKEVASNVTDEVRAWKDSRHEVAATSEEIMPADAEVMLPKETK
jgi:gas vesicle protein